MTDVNFRLPGGSARRFSPCPLHVAAIRLLYGKVGYARPWCVGMSMAVVTIVDLIRSVDPASAWKLHWVFVADMNGDGQVTITDVWMWGSWILFAPGDLLLLIIMLKLPNVATFLEMTPKLVYGGWSFILSIIIWWLLFVTLGHIRK
jgi:hypothetical protein